MFISSIIGDHTAISIKLFDRSDKLFSSTVIVEKYLARSQRQRILCENEVI